MAGLKTALIIIFVLVQAITGFITAGKTYTPIDTVNLQMRKKLAVQYQKKQKQFIKGLSTVYSGNELSFARNRLTSSGKEFYDEIVRGDYLFHDSLKQLLNQSYQQLKNNNKSVPVAPDFFISRDITMNAFSMTDQTYLINLGTFYFLENENQLTALLAHELAHKMLNHQAQSLKSMYKSYAEDAKKSLSEIRRSKYGRGTRALEKYRSMIYAQGKLSRKQEFEADSLGYLLYKNAGLNPSDYLYSFRMMFKYDTVPLPEIATDIYRKLFDLPTQPFNDNWMKMEDFSRYDYSRFREKFDRDSLSSHPEMDERIARLEQLYPELKEIREPEKPGQLFANIREMVRYERFYCLEYQENYGDGIFISIYYLTDTDESEKEYYEYWLGKYFNKILEARKTYTLNRYLERVDPKNQPFTYQQFLNFMWNLKVQEIEAIARHYTTTN
jgi:Zn-dependent protease with chaperone function